MRLLLISPFGLDGVGGSSRLLRDLAALLADKGHHVVVLTYGFKQRPDNASVLRNPKIVVSHIAPSSAAGSTLLRVMVRAVSLVFQERIQLLLCWTAYSAAFVGYAIKILLRIPFAVYSHGEDVTCVRGSARNTQLLGRTLRAASVVMGNSNYTLREVQSLGVGINKTKWVPPGIDIAPFESVEVAKILALKETLGVGDGPVLLTVARLEKRKGHDTVIRALPQILSSAPNALYLIVGKGETGPLKELATELQVSDHVKIIPYVAEDDLPAVFHLCDVHIMVSRFDPSSSEVEGFGMVYIEAAACQKPSIAGSEGGCADAVEDGVTGYVINPESPEDLSAAVKQLLDFPEVAIRMGTAAKMRVTQQFTTVILANKIENILIGL